MIAYLLALLLASMGLASSPIGIECVDGIAGITPDDGGNPCDPVNLD